MYNRDKKIFEAMEEVYKGLIADGHNVIHIFLQGSQNYNLDTLESDYDFKAITMPSKEDLYDGKQLSKVYTTPHGLVEVKDIRLFTKLINKMNPTYVELMYTGYNKGILELDEILADNLVKENFDTFLKSTLGTVRAKHAGVFKSTEGSAAILEKYGYQPKELHHFYRMHGILEAAIKNHDNIKENIIIEDPEYIDFLLKVKYPDKPADDKMLHSIKETIDSKLNYAISIVDNYLHESHKEADKPHTELFNKYIEELFYELLDNLV